MSKPAELDHVTEVAAFAFDDLRLTADAAVAEVMRQDALARRGRFGGTHVLPSGPNEARLAVLLEEVGEVAHELNEGWASDAGLDRDALIKELVQVAACAIAWATAVERRRY